MIKIKSLPKLQNYHSTKEIASIIRKEIKKAYPKYKFSVTMERNHIYIYMMEADFNPLTGEGEDRDYLQVNHYNIKTDNRLTEKAKDIFENIYQATEHYNWDKSDAMTDYFNVNFYLSMGVGKWDKPFKLVEKQVKPQRIKKTPEKIEGIEIIDYSEGAIMVKGDTKPVKEDFKRLRGKWIPSKKGWFFRKTDRAKVEEFLDSLKNPVSVKTKDKTEAQKEADEHTETFEKIETPEDLGESIVEEHNKEYVYQLYSRPFSIGTYPEDNFLRFEEDDSRFGRLIYSKLVPVSEQKHFSIIPFLDKAKYENKKIKIKGFETDDFTIKVNILDNLKGYNYAEITFTNIEENTDRTRAETATDFIDKIERGEYIIIPDITETELQPESKKEPEKTETSIEVKETKPATEFIEEKPDIIATFLNDYAKNKAIEKLIDYNLANNEEFTPDEKVFINTYSGYGGLQKFGAEEKGIMTEYFTPDPTVKKMWELAYKYGYDGGKVLENSVGVGRFLKYVPAGAKVEAFEINRYSYLICKILYPTIDIRNILFEQSFVNERNESIKGNVTATSDLVIGNPPYGDFDSDYSFTEKKYTKATNLIEYFITRSLDLLKAGGLLIYIIGVSIENGGTPFLDSGKTLTKVKIEEKADLIDAYRLGNKIFTHTSVLADIVVFRKK